MTGDDLGLSPEDREALLHAVAGVAPNEGAALSLLRPLDVDPRRLPVWAGTRPEDWWGQVFADFDNGVVASPYRRLLESAARRYPANRTFLRLTARTPRRAGSTPSPGRIFLCHSNNDKAAVRPLHRQLRDDGLAPWIDEEDLLPGVDFDLEIHRVIKESAAVLVLLTAESVAKRGYLQREIKRALDAADDLPEGEVFVIPVCLEKCEVPSRIARWQRLDLYRPGGYDRLLGTLRSVVARDEERRRR